MDRGALIAWKLEGYLGHPVRSAVTFGALVGVPVALVLVDQLRDALLGPPIGRVLFILVLLTVGAALGASAGTLIAVLRRQAFMDALTGLYNRRFMEAELFLLQSRAGRYGHAYSVLVLDLDGLKRVNDTFGHDAGDLALVKFADILRGAVRGSDVAIRTGGDEFVVILSETPCENVYIVFDRIRSRVRELRETDRRLVFTVSAGAVGWQSGATLDTLVQAADALLLKAKRSGKDRLATQPVAVQEVATSA